MPVNSGQYRHKIVIQKTAGVRNDFGGEDKTKLIVASPYCKITVLTDPEKYGSNTQGQTIVEVEMRYSKVVEEPTSKMFFVFRNEVYDIESVINPKMLNEKLILRAKRRQK